jgi:LAS superfamily LD-carboxypeptidase LdcB
MPLPPRLASLCLVVGLLTGVAVPASADTNQHKLKQAKAQAAKLDASAKQQAAQITVARSRLAALDAQANAALAGLQRATQAAAAATAAQAAAQAVLDAATAETTRARSLLNNLAANAYRTQSSGGSFAATLELVRTGDPATMIEGLNLLDQVGKTQSEALDDLKLAEAQQAHAEAGAEQATALAVRAEAGARTAKEQADAMVEQQAAAVQQLNQLLAATRQAAQSAHHQVTSLERAIAAARARAAAIRRAQALAAAHLPVAGCDGGSVAGYGNGQLPTGALCGLWGAPGEMLRADAAAAFNRMSQAFNAAFGEPLCVEASYRTYQRQVELYSSMPAGYAAVPGTSNHGWGLATDLCGGIQVDNSPEHMWLLDHAAAFNWFHPAWAMPGGGGPHEPWHWEYAG